MTSIYCEQVLCTNPVAYHFQHEFFCYAHLTIKLGYNPDNEKLCSCCSLIVPKLQRPKKKRTQEIETNKKYSNEQSPYWNHERAKSGLTEDGNIRESTLANADSLGEDEHLFHRPLTEEGELQFQTIRSALGELSPQQQKVLQLCGFDGLTIREAAKELGLSVGNVHELLQRARLKILEKYNQIKKSEKT